MRENRQVATKLIIITRIHPFFWNECSQVNFQSTLGQFLLVLIVFTDR